jgi:hypothetical protein
MIVTNTLGYGPRAAATQIAAAQSSDTIVFN